MKKKRTTTRSRVKIDNEKVNDCIDNYTYKVNMEIMTVQMNAIKADIVRKDKIAEVLRENLERNDPSAGSRASVSPAPVRASVSASPTATGARVNVSPAAAGAKKPASAKKPTGHDNPVRLVRILVQTKNIIDDIDFRYSR